MKRRLLQFYDSFGDRGVMFILYALAVVLNALPAVFAELPSVYPDEIKAAGVAALYSGKDWSRLLRNMGSGSGYVQALFYVPLFRLINNPYALYKAMLIINALIVGFIPLIVYHLAGKFGVLRVRQKLLIAMCCGLYPAYIVNSKFIWDESLTCLLVWLLVLCIFTAWEKTGKSSRAVQSVLTGFLCAVAYASNKRLISIVAALILTIIIARLVLREKILNLPVFGITLLASFTAEYFLRLTIEQALRGNSVSSAANIFIDGVGSAGMIFGVFFSHIYAFMTSSVGTGALAAAIFAVMLFSHLTEGIKARPKTLEDGTKVYEPVKHKYSTRLVVFAMFQFLAVGCTAMTSALFSFGADGRFKETELLGRYTDNIAPLAIFLVLVYVFLYSLDLTKPLIGAGIYGYSCFCFAIAGYPMTEISSSFKYSSIFGIFPMILGESAEGDSDMRYIIMSSLVLTLYALMIVFISCARKHKTSLVTGMMLCVLVAAAVYSGTVYLPRLCMQNSEETAPCKDVMRLLYNDSQSPPIIVYETAPKIAGTLQFLAPDTRVSILKKGGQITESCLLVAKNGAEVPFKGGSYDVVGRTEELAVYAYGETARDFIRYSSANEKNGAETSNSSSRIA